MSSQPRVISSSAPGSCQGHLRITSHSYTPSQGLAQSHLGSAQPWGHSRGPPALSPASHPDPGSAQPGVPFCPPPQDPIISQTALSRSPLIDVAKVVRELQGGQGGPAILQAALRGSPP